MAPKKSGGYASSSALSAKDEPMVGLMKLCGELDVGYKEMSYEKLLASKAMTNDVMETLMKHRVAINEELKQRQKTAKNEGYEKVIRILTEHNDETYGVKVEIDEATTVGVARHKYVELLNKMMKKGGLKTVPKIVARQMPFFVDGKDYGGNGRKALHTLNITKDTVIKVSFPPEVSKWLVLPKKAKVTDDANDGDEIEEEEEEEEDVEDGGSDAVADDEPQPLTATE